MNPAGAGALPPAFLAFAATAGLSFVIGLELHSYRRGAGAGLGFGTTRTLTLVGVAGFAAWRLAARQPLAFPVALAALALWLALEYRARIARGEESLLPTLVALLVFLLGPL
ncbi:MAG: MgtC/SapB family protein, partial [Acetobacteraceae bacterium]